MTQPSFHPAQSRALENQPPERTVGKQYQPLALVLLVTAIVLGGIGSRLAYLQIYEGDRNRSLAETNRIRLVPQAPERGQIVDSRGRVLADNRLAHSLAAWPIGRSLQEWHALIPTLARILDIPKGELHQRIESEGYRSMTLVRLARDITPQQMTALVELQTSEDGLEIIKESARVYPYGPLARPTLGQVREAQTSDVPDDQPSKIQVGDWLGVTGLEAALNGRLKGDWGVRQVELGESPGEAARPLAGRNAQGGETIRLTLDARIQQSAERVLGDRSGALVVLHAETGKVIALVSHSTASPSKTLDVNLDSNLDANTALPAHLALTGQVPGSLFQLVTATAALESGNVSPQRRLRVRPWQRVGGVAFRDRYQSASANFTLRAALKQPDSILTETLFEQLTLTMGTGEAITWARKLGLGQRTGIELGREETLPLALEQLWKQEAERERWFVADGVNLALGRGKLRVSPLQMAVFVGALVNGGYRVQPHLVDDATPKASRQFVGLKPTTVKTVRQGFEVEPLAIAPDFEMPQEKALAQTLPEMAGRRSTVSLPDGKQWHWFAGYAPVRSPQYVAVAIVADTPSESNLSPSPSNPAPANNSAVDDAAATTPIKPTKPVPGHTVAQHLVQRSLWDSLDPYGAGAQLEPQIPEIDSPPPVNIPLTEPVQASSPESEPVVE